MQNVLQIFRIRAAFNNSSYIANMYISYIYNHFLMYNTNYLYMDQN